MWPRTPASTNDPSLGAPYVLLWFATHMIARRYAIPSFGCGIVGGTYRWRSAVGLITQLVALPMLLCFAVSVETDLTKWSIRCSAHGLGAHDWGFVYIFGGLMCIDFIQLQLSPLLKLHHATCLGGHAYACCNPVAFPAYMCAVVALELGSAGSGMNCLRPKAFSAAQLVMVMAASNLAALGCLWQWHALMHEQRVGRWVGAMISIVLIVVRQNDAIQLWRATHSRTSGCNVQTHGD